jgi:hypothetical protein
MNTTALTRSDSATIDEIVYSFRGARHTFDTIIDAVLDAYPQQRAVASQRRLARRRFSTASNGPLGVRAAFGDHAIGGNASDCSGSGSGRPRRPEASVRILGPTMRRSLNLPKSDSVMCA